MTVYKKKLESAIESYFTKQAIKHGFLCWKFISPSQDGVPDRILIGHETVAFAELKRPGEKPRPLQEYIIKRLRDHGAIVGVIDSNETADQFIQELTQNKRKKRN